MASRGAEPDESLTSLPPHITKTTSKAVGAPATQMHWHTESFNVPVRINQATWITLQLPAQPPLKHDDQVVQTHQPQHPTIEFPTNSSPRTNIKEEQLDPTADAHNFKYKQGDQVYYFSQDPSTLVQDKCNGVLHQW